MASQPLIVIAGVPSHPTPTTGADIDARQRPQMGTAIKSPNGVLHARSTEAGRPVAPRQYNLGPRDHWPHPSRVCSCNTNVRQAQHTATKMQAGEQARVVALQIAEVLGKHAGRCHGQRGSPRHAENAADALEAAGAAYEFTGALQRAPRVGCRVSLLAPVADRRNGAGDDRRNGASFGGVKRTSRRG